MKYLFFIVCMVWICTSCEKDNNDNAIPPGLVIEAKVSADSVGLVEFMATAPNASNYTFDFGDGTTGAAANGQINHTYTKIGNNTFYVVVTASGASASVTKTIPVMISINSNIPGLIWADEFDISGAPNPINWTFETGRGNNGWGNSELQYYTNRSQNASVSGGTLKIVAAKEDFSGAAYTSARMITKGKFEFQYGRVEARAKLPAGAGTWPAIWMLGADINSVGWPACGEIDIMEHRGTEPNKIHGSLHYPGRSGGNPVSNTVNITNVSSEFHVYSVDWTASNIRFAVDGNVFFTVPNSQGIPFNKDFFLILNVAMGGTFGGPVNPTFTSSPMEIDYIRVFRN